MKHEVKQLTLLLGRVKYRPLVWRNTHPYVVVDRHEDITHPAKVEEEGEGCERSVAFYGYVRGTNLKEGMKVHLIGVGDFGMVEVGALGDPCPVFDKEKDNQVSKRENFGEFIGMFGWDIVEWSRILVEIISGFAISIVFF